MKYLAVKDFKKHQHYSDRVPPWIKLYNSILDDYAFLQLSDASRSHLMLLWLLASRTKNRIPYDVKYITGVIKARGKIDFDALIASGLLSIVDSAEEEPPSTNASFSGDVEERREEEKRGEKKRGEEKGPADARASTATAPAESGWEYVLSLVPDWHRREFTAERHAQLPDGVRRGLSKIGGFRAISTTSDEKIVWLKKDFMAAYNG